MRQTRQTDSPGARADQPLAAIRRAWTGYWTRRAARATMGILHGLDDRALKDLGLDRSEIERVANGDCRRACPCHAGA